MKATNIYKTVVALLALSSYIKTIDFDCYKRYIFAIFVSLLQ